MALKKDHNSVDLEQEKSHNEDASPLKLKNSENKEIESQPLEVSKGDDNENGFLDFGFNQSILKSLINKGCLLYTSPSPRDKRQSRMPSSA